MNTLKTPIREKKSFAKRYIEKRLFTASKKVLEKYKPKVVAITGSVGKTSTRQAIFTVLNLHEGVRQSSENYNNEIGVPLTILGEVSPKRNIAGWLGVFWRAKKLLWEHDPEYPKVLILEVGIDEVGDMDYLMKLVTPDVGVLTAIGISHLAKFGTQENLTREKRKLVQAVRQGGYSLLNADNDLARQSASVAAGTVVTYGFRNGSDLVASDVTTTQRTLSDSQEERELAAVGFPLGVSFKVQYQGKNVPFYLHRVLGKHQILPVLPAIICGTIFGMNLVEISEALKQYVPPRGRMNLISGIKGSLIIDDTYNAAPDSTLEALKALKEMKTPGRRVAILSDMLELGEKTEESHRAAGKAAADSCDVLIAFGNASVFIAEEARAAGMDPKNVHYVTEGAHDKIEQIIQNWIKKGDVLLVKGSQSMRMEKVVYKLMSHPEHAERLLVRHTPRWLAKPFEMPQG